MTKDSNSPTGYTATFVYKDALAKTVQFYGETSFYIIADGQSVAYSPYQWKDGMFQADVAKYTKDMTKVAGTDYWTISMPLPSGAFLYQYKVDGTLKYDPANVPSMNPNGGKQTRSVVNVPFDTTKQSVDNSIVLPRTDGKTGIVNYVAYSTNGLLTKDQPLGIYLPNGYDVNRTEPYKVIYLSYGGGGNEFDWFSTGSANSIMDNLIAKEKTEAAIIVTMDNAAFSWNYDNMTKNVLQNIIPYVESHYNVSKEVKGRAFVGLFMGGMTTSKIYYTSANKFGYFGIFSGAVAWEDLDQYNMKNLKIPSLMVGFGCYDIAYKNSSYGTSSDRTIQGFVDRLDAADIDYDFSVVNGAHDCSTWNQLLTIFLTKTAWKEKAVPEPTATPTVAPTATPTAAPTIAPSYNDGIAVKDSVTLYVGRNSGKTTTIDVTLPVGAVKASTTFKSNNNNVMTVDANGKVSAKAIGQAIITTTVKLTNGETAKLSTVITVKKEYLTLTKKKASVAKGKTFTFRAKAYGSTKKVTWKYSNKKVATISSSGKLKAIKKGTVKITVTSGTLKITYNVKVK